MIRRRATPTQQGFLDWSLSIAGFGIGLVIGTAFGFLFGLGLAAHFVMGSIVR